MEGDDNREAYTATLHPEKTRLIPFGRHTPNRHGNPGPRKSGTFNFLGFTCISGKSRQGKFLIKRTSRRDRMRAKLKSIKEELRRRMHQPILETGKWLKRVVTGYFNYHVVPTNSRTINTFRHRVSQMWCRALRRRSQKDFTNWKRMEKLIESCLPKPRILHPWPQQRIAVKHPRLRAVCGKAARTVLCGLARNNTHPAIKP